MDQASLYYRLAASPREDVQRLISRSFSIVMQSGLREKDDEELAEETRRILEGLSELQEAITSNVRESRRILDEYMAKYRSLLGSDPEDSVRFLAHSVSKQIAEGMVQSVLGVSLI